MGAGGGAGGYLNEVMDSSVVCFVCSSCMWCSGTILWWQVKGGGGEGWWEHGNRRRRWRRWQRERTGDICFSCLLLEHNIDSVWVCVCVCSGVSAGWRGDLKGQSTYVKVKSSYFLFLFFMSCCKLHLFVMVTTNIKCITVNSWTDSHTKHLRRFHSCNVDKPPLTTQKNLHTQLSQNTHMKWNESVTHDHVSAWRSQRLVPESPQLLRSCDVLNSSRCTNTNSNTNINKIWVQLFVGVTWSQLPGVLAVFPAGQWSISTSELLHCSLSAVPADSNSKLPAIDVLWMSEVPPSTWRFFYFGKQLLTFGS